MSWIADVIYGLKHENGRCVTICRDSSTLDVVTGNQTRVTRQVLVQNVIPLSLSTRQAFMKAMHSGIKDAYLKLGQTQFIVDPEDMPADFVVTENDYLIDAKGRKFVVDRVEDVEDEVLILTASSV